MILQAILLLLAFCFATKSSNGMAASNNLAVSSEESEAVKRQKAAFAAKSGDITIRFYATVDPETPISVRPLEVAKRAKRDVPGRVMYEFRNLTKETINIRATHKISPESADASFRKLVCFCFENQTLGPGERRELPVVYIINPELKQEIDTIKLDYVVYRLVDSNDISKADSLTPKPKADLDKGH